jgi:hypothetical protein
MTDVPERLIGQGFHLFVRDMAGTGCHAVQILDQIPSGRLALWLVRGGCRGIRHHRDLFLIRHFPTEQALNGVSGGIAQFVSSTDGNGLHTVSKDQSTSPAYSWLSCERAIPLERGRLGAEKTGGVRAGPLSNSVVRLEDVS